MQRSPAFTTWLGVADWKAADTVSISPPSESSKAFMFSV